MKLIVFLFANIYGSLIDPQITFDLYYSKLIDHQSQAKLICKEYIKNLHSCFDFEFKEFHTAAGEDYIKVNQVYKNLPVVNGEMILMLRDQRVVLFSSAFNLSVKGLSPIPSIDALTAFSKIRNGKVYKIINDKNGDQFLVSPESQIKFLLCFVQTSASKIELSWQYNVLNRNLMFLSAVNGKVVHPTSIPWLLNKIV